ncbi:MAG: type II 3-dehydroquinate dehydratase [Oscillospiraceae bacterium]|nr:type II 3-dehydroquinate dehydratase [Oscillospiraceae bacterium]MDD4413256.1 type II 3-dehydroquinate dehydratase [Oscillospiraceae bacterium]
MKKILILNGPNLNLLGMREPEVYGADSYDKICSLIAQHSQKRGLEAEFYQSNSEGGLIDRLHECVGSVDGVILNAGAYTHTSYALRDAVSAIGIPVIEVHMSNIHAREEFRRKSVISAVCRGQIAGFGVTSYLLAVDALLSIG